MKSQSVGWGIEMLDATEFAAQTGWTEQELAEAVREHRVFYVGDNGEQLFPAFLSEPSYNMARLQQVCRALGTLPSGAKLQFFLSRRGSLGGASVLEALLEGDITPVLAAAEAYAAG